MTLLDHVRLPVPHPRFLGVAGIDAELHRMASASAGVVRLETIGSARSGHPLQMLSIGSGARHAVVIGMSHPNEPTGSLGALMLTGTLARDDALRRRLGLAWHIVPCGDPDGTRLNEGWFSGPYDYANYARHFYRPPFAEQVEWTFRIPDREKPGLPTLPESRALMAVIDSFKPELLVSMHNAEVGGLFCYVTDPAPDLTEAMVAIREVTQLPAYLGEPEVPATVRSPGVFIVPPAVDGAAMISSADYAARYGAFGIVTEPPMWADARAADGRPTGSTRAQTDRWFAQRSAELSEEYARWLVAVDGKLTLRTALRRSVEDDAIALADGSVEIDPSGDLDGPSTVAYRNDLESRLHMRRLRAAGHFSGALRAELASGSGDGTVRRVLAVVDGRIAQWSAEAGDPALRFVGLSGAIQAHVGLALGSAFGLL
jgi:hypothetical protein